VVIQYVASFFSAFIIAFVKSWKFALILSCIFPAILCVFGVGGTFQAKFAQQVVSEYAKASTVAEEIISSVRTAQAFGTQDKLANLYDDNLIAAQKIGYKQQISGAFMLATMFFSVYAFYGLGFCTWIFVQANRRGRISVAGCW
jgi:ATP-binding cassette, subfamily B (MDR/TAP), member 1